MHSESLAYSCFRSRILWLYSEQITWRSHPQLIWIFAAVMIYDKAVHCQTKLKTISCSLIFLFVIFGEWYMELLFCASYWIWLVRLAINYAAPNHVAVRWDHGWIGVLNANLCGVVTSKITRQTQNVKVQQHCLAFKLLC